MNTSVPTDGLWPLVVINVPVFIIFPFSFTHPLTAREKQGMGAPRREQEGVS